MEQLIIIVLLLLGSAIFNWITNRKRQESEEGTPVGPRPGPPQPAAPPSGRDSPSPRPRPVDWESELRRLLEGEEPASPVEPSRPPLPQPPPPGREVVPTPSPQVRPAPVVRSMPPPLPVFSAEQAREEEGPASHLAALAESATAYQRAGALDRQVAARLQQLHDRPVPMTQPVHLRRVPEEARQIAGLLRHPKSVRQAMVASFVLGPPKALEY